MKGRQSLDRTLAALADPTRRRVVNLLRLRPHRAGEIAAAMNVSAPAMSRHLRTLRATGLVLDDRDEFDARVRIYRLSDKPMADLRAWLEETEVLWSRQLTALKSHLKRNRG
jgi:DNA-binding transcriptional ArsR family regulator